MSLRSVIETLDLHDDYGDYHSEVCGSQNCGCLSPRISFSTDFISGASGRLSPEKQRTDEGLTYSPDFEFSMSSFNILDAVPPGYIVPADELFHKGKLLPGFIPPCPTTKDAVTVQSLLPERPEGCPVLTTSGHMSTEIASAPSPSGCVLGPSCVRASKGPKWRELFGALRRVKSDSGRQRIPDESLLPPKTMHGRKKFFKHFFSSGQNGIQDPKFSAMSRTSSSVSISAVLAAQDANSAPDSLPSTASRGSCARAAVDSKDKAAVNPPQPSSTEAGRGELRTESRGRPSELRSEDFTFNPLPGRPSSRPSSSSSSCTGRSSPIKVPARGANLMRSASGRVIVRGLDRVSSGRNASSLQEQIRALRSREIRRSPERSGYSSVRVTPVLNVPVCMGPVLRGASKAGKGRLSNFRSFLTFKSKLPTSLAAPIATR